MRRLGLLVLLTVLTSCQGPESPPVELITEEFNACLEAHKEYARIIDRQIGLLDALLNERLRLSTEYAQGQNPRLAYIAMQDINVKIQEAQGVQVDAATPIWESCYPVLEFVAAGLDGHSGDFGAEPESR